MPIILRLKVLAAPIHAAADVLVAVAASNIMAGEVVKPKLAELSPMMRQYMLVKEQCADCLVLYRLGDFYELFFDDAIVASKELELVLTGRDCGLAERAPMCGVPHHAVEGYINKLTSKGFKVAICEQLSDPKQGKGIVERGVVRIVTPGTAQSGIDVEEDNNYIMSICKAENTYGFAVCDVSTGEFVVGSTMDINGLYGEISRFSPTEIITADELKKQLTLSKNCFVFEYGDWAFKLDSATESILRHFKVGTIQGFGDIGELEIRAGGALLSYLSQTQKNALAHITQLKLYEKSSSMVLDEVTRRNLELTESMSLAKGKGKTLFGLLNKTSTSAGARLLRQWIGSPLFNIDKINIRQQCVNDLFLDVIFREELQSALSGVYDMERVCSKLAYGNVNAKQLLSLMYSCKKLPYVLQILSRAKSERLENIANNFDILSDICNILGDILSEDAPATLNEGGLIKDGYNESVDKLRNAANMGQSYLEDLEAKEREITGIKNLKIAYNRVFGYYIEVTKSNLSVVPFRYVRKQTLSNCERYITEELKKLEEELIGAKDKLIALEFEIFSKLRESLGEHIGRIQATAAYIAELDCYASLAKCAVEYNYCLPEITKDGALEIKDGRHPVVERKMQGSFVTNNTIADTENNRLLIITGPNMAGKSTYMRQVALIVLMAHVGSFVPASSAKIPLTDRIFTRVGASDDLSSGKSTFMVEMSETANILQNATDKSLILLDEIGRGTSTFDGLSIAWAVCEYVASKATLGAKTLFATHYHELSDLEGIVDGVACYRITARDVGDEIIFLRQIVKGGTDKSFGIQVARLAGIPQSVINRAKEILIKLEAAEINTSMQKEYTMQQSSMFLSENPDNTKLIDTLCALDIEGMTPMKALMMLEDLKVIALKAKQDRAK